MYIELAIFVIIAIVILLMMITNSKAMLPGEQYKIVFGFLFVVIFLGSFFLAVFVAPRLENQWLNTYLPIICISVDVGILGLLFSIFSIGKAIQKRKMTQHKTTQDTVVQDFDILKACMKTSSDVVRSYHSPKIKTLYELIIRYKDNLGKNHYCRSNELYTIEQITYIIENKKNFKIDIVGNSKKKLCALIGEVKSSTVNMKALGDIEIINSQSTAEKYLPACEFAILSIIDALMIYAVFFKFQYTNLATRLVLYFFAIAFFIVSFVILIQLTKMIKLPRMKDAKKTVTKDFYVYFIDRPTFGGKIYYVKFLFVDDNGQIRIAKQVVSMFRYDMIKKIKELPIAVHGTKAAIDFDKINF